MAETTHTTSTEHVPAAEHGGGFPPFNGETFASQLFWLVIAFVLLYALMSRWALPQVARVIEGRQKRIDDDIAEAGRLKAQSDEAVAAYEKALGDARARAQAIAGETRDAQAAEAEAARKKTEEELNARMAEAEKTIAATKTAAMANVQTIAKDTAGAIVERLIGKAPGEQTVADAVSAVLKR